MPDVEYVARLFILDFPTKLCVKDDSLDGLRVKLMQIEGRPLTILPRSPQDEPQIVECWI